MKKKTNISVQDVRGIRRTPDLILGDKVVKNVSGDIMDANATEELVNDKIAEVIGTAPEILDTLGEIVQELETKADKSDLDEKADKSDLEDYVAKDQFEEHVDELNNDEKVIAAAINEVAQNIKPITWAQLKFTRDNGGLIPGMQYRITDWQPVTSEEKNLAGENGFDIVVTATTNDSINEMAKAIGRKSVDTYYVWQKFENGKELPYYALTEALYQPGDVSTDSPAKMLPMTDDQKIYGHMSDIFVEVVEEDGELKAYKTDGDSYPDDPDYEDWYIYTGETITFKPSGNDANVNCFTIWYSIDNDVKRFPQVSSESKGVVYRVFDDEVMKVLNPNGTLQIEYNGKKKDVLKALNIGRYKMVDLGLPSGIMWADCNVGAENPEDNGLFFSWGSVEGATANSGRSFDGTRNSEKNWSGTYGTEHGSLLGDTDNIPVGEYFDAARKYMGSTWRMPRSNEFQELVNNCTWTWTTLNGVNGYNVEGQNGNSIFFPASGYCSGTSLFNVGSDGRYWSASYVDEYGAYYLSFDSDDVSPESGSRRYGGFTVRAVSDAVDLGLPSGRLWSTKNLGASSSTENGLFFSWGNIEGHDAQSGYNFSQQTYEGTKGHTFTTDLYNNSSCDAAKAMLGGDWHMPSKDDFAELYENTTSEWVTVDGVTGRKFTGKNGVSIFFPASGYCNGTSRRDEGSNGRYWSTSYYDESYAYYLLFGSDGVDPEYNGNRYNGLTIRPVQ